MYSALRAQKASARCCRTVFSRSLASVAPSTSAVARDGEAPPSSSTSSSYANTQHGIGATAAPQPESETQMTFSREGRAKKLRVKEDHGFYAFFRRKADIKGDLTGEDRYNAVEMSQEDLQARGRPWKAAELRLKSFKDLHTLWYVIARERNLIATQKQELRRMRAPMESVGMLLSSKDKLCRITQGRIKEVLNERRLAYEGAVKLAQQEQEDFINAQTDAALLRRRKQEQHQQTHEYAVNKKRLEEEQKRLEAVEEETASAEAETEAAVTEELATSVIDGEGDAVVQVEEKVEAPSKVPPTSNP